MRVNLLQIEIITHVGEGIFFSSRLMDKFIIYSDGRYFSHDSYDSEQLLKIFLRLRVEQEF